MNLVAVTSGYKPAPDLTDWIIKPAIIAATK